MDDRTRDHFEDSEARRTLIDMLSDAKKRIEVSANRFAKFADRIAADQERSRDKEGRE